MQQTVPGALTFPWLDLPGSRLAMAWVPHAGFLLRPRTLGSQASLECLLVISEIEKPVSLGLMSSIEGILQNYQKQQQPSGAVQLLKVPAHNRTLSRAYAETGAGLQRAGILQGRNMLARPAGAKNSSRVW